MAGGAGLLELGALLGLPARGPSQGAGVQGKALISKQAFKAPVGASAQHQLRVL